ncbi:hypothetical protein ABEG10_38200 (plasmid) [Burkholderia cenocepacia]|uniref:hypothetical protein n=1 Tax=Burkholderia cenocepacia TaxID=95486 RepID=UPI00209CB16D|nr:hypothetical protein [Burkholderia cenocepacia]MCO8402780.1 hypothetical protein [Burkholderia cenocepacia]MCO8415116.1 hypothetical protein [Burkholderia cenocepacia]MCO8423085.1 hypothetical protein [Burkholderia cenocepacia]MCO8474766.1 hypothetical protein [Burkholderia cenocepacia]MCO8482054.1 hypothetical protein [Burkholderia cenocepacia]
MAEQSTLYPFVDLSTAEIADYVSRLGAFVSSDIAFSRAPDDLDARLAVQDAAARIRPDCTRPGTIADLSRSLMKRAYSQVYEQYAERMVNEIERAARSFDPLIADALRIYCGVEQLRRDARDCSEAVSEAFHGLYGNEYGNDD